MKKILAPVFRALFPYAGKPWNEKMGHIESIVGNDIPLARPSGYVTEMTSEPPRAISMSTISVQFHYGSFRQDIVSWKVRSYGLKAGTLVSVEYRRSRYNPAMMQMRLSSLEKSRLRA